MREMVAFGDIWRVNYKSKNRHIYLYVELFFPNQTERLSNKTVKLLKSQRVKSLVSNSKVSEVILKFPSLLALMEGQTSKRRLQLGSLVDDHPGGVWCLFPLSATYHALSSIKVLQGRTINIDGADPSLGLIIKKRFMEMA